MVGCRMRQACGARAEKAVEVGRNDKDGTNREVAAPDRREWEAESSDEAEHEREWTLEACVDEGAVFGQPQERSPSRRREARRSGSGFGQTRAASQAAAGRTARCVTRLRRGREGHEGPTASRLTRAEKLSGEGSTSEVTSARVGERGARPGRSSGEGQRSATLILRASRHVRSGGDGR